MIIFDFDGTLGDTRRIDVKEAKPKPEPVLKTLADMHYDAGVF